LVPKTRGVVSMLHRPEDHARADLDLGAFLDRCLLHCMLELA